MSPEASGLFLVLKPVIPYVRDSLFSIPRMHFDYAQHNASTSNILNQKPESIDKLYLVLITSTPSQSSGIPFWILLLQRSI